MSSKLEKIRGFIEEYKNFCESIEGARINHSKTRFSKLFQGYESVRKIQKEIESHTAYNYNVFELLDVHRKEVKMHTPFLANLLNPRGNHAQGDLFLKSFIESFIPIERRSVFATDDYFKYTVTKEKVVFEGQIDVYINSIRSAILIENKIYAGDQNLQLERYYNYLKRQKYDFIMFYLTLNQQSPSDFSMSKSLREEMLINNTLVCIDYKLGIVNWLGNLLPHVKSEKIKSIIEQYILTIKIL